MEYNSAMKTNVIGDTTQINLEVNINKQKKNKQQKTKPKRLYAVRFHLYNILK